MAIIHQNYQTIQALRFVAAASVCLTHATFYIKTRVDPSVIIWEAGSQGVQIFFVISGFVMAINSGAVTNQLSDWRNFILKRLIRIAPLYWIMNIIKLVVLVVVPGSLIAKPDFQNIIFSLLFTPSRNKNGLIETFYGVGWTLNFEMFFYVLITVGLLFKMKLIRLLVSFLGVCVIVGTFRQENWPTLSYFLHPYLANFIWGLIIAKIASKIEMDRPRMGLALTAISTYSVFFDPIHPSMYLFGIQYGALVLGLVMMESRLTGRIPRILLFGGDASYSLYLTHSLSGPVAVIFSNRIGLFSRIGSLSFIAAVMLFTAIACFIYVEKPIAKAISRMQQKNTLKTSETGLF